MALIEWNPGMSVGVERIDLQHQKLVEVINDLNEAIGAGKGEAVQEALFLEVVDYFTQNFDTEEELMSAHSYPEFEVHRNLHEGFSRRVRELRSRASAGAQGISEEALHFLMDWLVRHDIAVDKKLGAYLNERGIK